MTIPVLETSADCSNLFSVHSNAKCGIVVFDAGKNVPLFSCGLTKRGAP
jgi:hypothetical protein